MADNISSTLESKEEILLKLKEKKKEAARKLRKLEKAKRAERVRAHTLQKIREHQEQLKLEESLKSEKPYASSSTLPQSWKATSEEEPLRKPPNIVHPQTSLKCSSESITGVGSESDKLRPTESVTPHSSKSPNQSWKAPSEEKLSIKQYNTVHPQASLKCLTESTDNEGSGKLKSSKLEKTHSSKSPYQSWKAPHKEDFSTREKQNTVHPFSVKASKEIITDVGPDKLRLKEQPVNGCNVATLNIHGVTKQDNCPKSTEHKTQEKIKETRDEVRVTPRQRHSVSNGFICNEKWMSASSTGRSDHKKENTKTNEYDIDLPLLQSTHKRNKPGELPFKTMIVSSDIEETEGDNDFKTIKIHMRAKSEKQKLSSGKEATSVQFQRQVTTKVQDLKEQSPVEGTWLHADKSKSVATFQQFKDSFKCRNSNEATKSSCNKESNNCFTKEKTEHRKSSEALQKVDVHNLTPDKQRPTEANEKQTKHVDKKVQEQTLPVPLSASRHHLSEKLIADPKGFDNIQTSQTGIRNEDDSLIKMKDAVEASTSKISDANGNNTASAKTNEKIPEVVSPTIPVSGTDTSDSDEVIAASQTERRTSLVMRRKSRVEPSSSLMVSNDTKEKVNDFESSQELCPTFTSLSTPHPADLRKKDLLKTQVLYEQNPVTDSEFLNILGVSQTSLTASIPDDKLSSESQTSVFKQQEPSDEELDQVKDSKLSEAEQSEKLIDYQISSPINSIETDQPPQTFQECDVAESQILTLTNASHSDKKVCNRKERSSSQQSPSSSNRHHKDSPQVVPDSESFSEFTELDAIPFSQFEFTEDFLSKESSSQTDTGWQIDRISAKRNALIKRRSPRISSIPLISSHSDSRNVSQNSQNHNGRVLGGRAGNRKSRVSQQNKAVAVLSVFQFLKDEVKKEDSFQEFVLSKEFDSLKLGKMNESSQQANSSLCAQDFESFENSSESVHTSPKLVEKSEKLMSSPTDSDNEIMEVDMENPLAVDESINTSQPTQIPHKDSVVTESAVGDQIQEEFVNKKSELIPEAPTQVDEKVCFDDIACSDSQLLNVDFDEISDSVSDKPDKEKERDNSVGTSCSYYGNKTPGNKNNSQGNEKNIADNGMNSPGNEKNIAESEKSTLISTPKSSGVRPKLSVGLRKKLFNRSVNKSIQHLNEKSEEHSLDSATHTKPSLQSLEHACDDKNDTEPSITKRINLDQSSLLFSPKNDALSKASDRSFQSPTTPTCKTPTSVLRSGQGISFTSTPKTDKAPHGDRELIAELQFDSPLKGLEDWEDKEKDNSIQFETPLKEIKEKIADERIECEKYITENNVSMSSRDSENVMMSELPSVISDGNTSSRSQLPQLSDLMDDSYLSPGQIPPQKDILELSDASLLEAGAELSDMKESESTLLNQSLCQLMNPWMKIPKTPTTPVQVLEEQSDKSHLSSPVFTPNRRRGRAKPASQDWITMANSGVLKFSGCFQPCSQDAVVSLLSGEITVEDKPQPFMVSVQATALTVWAQDVERSWVTELDWRLSQTTHIMKAKLVSTSADTIAVAAAGMQDHQAFVNLFVYSWSSEDTTRIKIPLAEDYEQLRTPSQLLICPVSPTELYLGITQTSFYAIRKVQLSEDRQSAAQTALFSLSNGQLLSVVSVNGQKSAVLALTGDQKITLWNTEIGAILKIYPLPRALPCFTNLMHSITQMGYIFMDVMWRTEMGHSGAMVGLNPMNGVFHQFYSYSPPNNTWKGIDCMWREGRYILAVSDGGSLAVWNGQSGHLLGHTKSKSTTCATVIQTMNSLVVGEIQGCLHLYSGKR